MPGEKMPARICPCMSLTKKRSLLNAFFFYPSSVIAFLRGCDIREP